jgi:DNA-binding NtrC family response regulator
MPAARIMLIDNEAGLCRMMEAVLRDQGYQVKAYTNPVQAVADFTDGTYDLVITDIKMPEMDGLEVLQHLRRRSPEIQVIMITAFATVEMSIQALRRGAYDMLTKPFEPDELIYRVKNALQHHALVEENRELKEELTGKFHFDRIIGASAGLRDLLERVAKVAVRDTGVLITGESGTGKELIAQAIHHHSPRRDRKFIAVNCGALPENILESELFGYRKGAFTGATENRQGLLEAADGGTLFLDEVGNLPHNVQKTLLRFLQEQEFRRLGDTTPTKVNVRLISATNSDLTAEVAKGTFREDLFYRLNVINLHLPPLRERRDDIPLLIAHFLREQNEKFGTSCKGLTPEALEAACACAWPGNIRQLRNVIEAALTIESGSYIGLPALSQFIVTGQPGQFSTQADYEAALARFETEYLTRLLRKHAGNVEAAAAEAGMNMATVYRKLKKYGIRKKEID